MGFLADAFFSFSGAGDYYNSGAMPQEKRTGYDKSKLAKMNKLTTNMLSSYTPYDKMAKPEKESKWYRMDDPNKENLLNKSDAEVEGLYEAFLRRRKEVEVLKKRPGRRQTLLTGKR